MIWLDLALGSKAENTVDYVLDGRRFRINARWVGRANSWVLALHDADGNQLIAGVPVRSGVSLLRPHVGSAFPGTVAGRGHLVAVDTSRRGVDPGRNDLGVRVRLAYVPVAEVGA